MRRTSSLRLKVRIGAGVVFVGVALIIFGAMPAIGASTNQLQTVVIREDRFRNFDFLSTENRAGNVDWAISLLFMNNAEIDKVKDKLKPYYYWEGSPMHGLLNNGDGWHWDQDSGKKQVKCVAVGDSVHYRVYATVNDRMYNLSWGYYIFGSTHIDHNECNAFGRWSGMSETAERNVAAAARAVWGSARVTYDWASFFNAMPTYNQGDHHWENDGYATKVRVP